MEGDMGYHLMSTFVAPELMKIPRNRQPPHRKQAKPATISTWTPAATADANSPRTTASTLASPPIMATTTTAETAAATTPAFDNNLAATPASSDATSTTNTNNNTTNTKTHTSYTHGQPRTRARTHDQLPLSSLRSDHGHHHLTLEDADNPELGSYGNRTGEALDDHGQLDGRLAECDDPASSGHSTAGGRYGSGDHRSWLFGRPARRRTASLTKSPASGSSPPPSTSSGDRSNSTDTSYSLSSDRRAPAARAPRAVAPSLTSSLTPAFATPPASSRDSFFQRLPSDGRADDANPRQSHPSLARPSWLDYSLPWRSAHQLPHLSPAAEALTGAAKASGAHGHDIMPSSALLNQPPYPVQHHMPGDVPSTRSSAPAHQSGTMSSSEALLPPTVERSSAITTAFNPPATPSKPVITQLQEAKAFVIRNGRTYINENTLPYPLPVDLPELHRQSLRTLLMFQLFGGPILSSAFASKPPTRVLDVGCGAGFWSMMCHRYFAQHGHANVSFTGLDIVPLGGSGSGADMKPDKEMQWKFVQHDIRQLPWPFADGEFDLIMVKDMAFASSFRDSQLIIEEYLRVLKPGGTLEYWETDSTIRMLRPHAPKKTPRIRDDDSSSDGGDDEDNAERMGAYVMTTNTPISAPLNPYLVEYNGWSSKALEARGLSAVPCTLIGAYLLQEAESLTDVQSKRLAVPLSEIRWEREGVGGVVTKDGKSYIDSQKGKYKDQDWKTGSPVTPAQSALRRTALETTVSFILALEPVLKEVSGKSQEEWDTWAGKMTNDLLREGGTSWGECLEVGVWTARKRHHKL
ncbi:hypothetical protein F4777DRAFT_53045 [Nemania sp. FL0916]|nr:hypothetical protein F4777DRAFT_53045 [Nemania sp. FL0916]